MREEPEVFKKYDIRGEVPGELDSELVFELGKCLGDFWDAGRVCIGRDTRESSPDFYDSMTAGLKAAGCHVAGLGLATTDMVALAAKERFDAGVMITASHMPPGHGGFKPLNSEGRILSNEEMAAVKETYTMQEAETREGGAVREEDFLERYREKILERYGELFQVKPSGINAVVDSSNSVGKLAAPDILGELGAETVEINSELDPGFPAHSPEPSEKSARQLSEKVAEEDADLGIIFDGDADRVMFVDEKGEFLPGDTALGIFAEKFLEHSNRIVLSVNTSSEVKSFVRSSGGEIVFTPPGAVFTALKCLEEGATFGGQPNGHLMDSELVPYDSGTHFAALMTGILAEKNRELSEIREKFEKLEKRKLDFETPRKNEKMLEIREKAGEKNLIESEEFNTLSLNYRDLKILLRPSGSEDLIRVRVEGKKITEEDLNRIREFLEDSEPG